MLVEILDGAALYLAIIVVVKKILNASVKNKMIKLRICYDYEFDPENRFTCA